MTVRFFNDHATHDGRACQIWQILVGCAARRETKTYQDLADLLGHKQPKVLAKQLGRIMYYYPGKTLGSAGGLQQFDISGIRLRAVVRASVCTSA